MRKFLLIVIATTLFVKHRITTLTWVDSEMDVHLLRVVRPGYQKGKYNLVDTIGGRVAEDVVLESAAPVVWMKL